MKKCLLTLTLSSVLVYSDSKIGFDPYYAGTQLAFYPVNSSPGYVGICPSIALIQYKGSYNSKWHEKSVKKLNRFITYDSISTGITSWLDTSIYFGGGYQQFGPQHDWGLIDTSIYFGLQITREKKGGGVPDMRLLIGETFPTGKYDHLDPNKGDADQFGTGSYITSVVFVIGKTFYPLRLHPIYLDLNVYYYQPSSVRVHGLSYYGGDRHTRGRVYPQSGLITNISIQISLNKYWALGTDINYIHENKTTFKGHSTPHFKPGFPSSEQFSLAPCLEYSWSENGCMSLGPWFTVAGRNSSAFSAFLANAYWYF